LDIRLLHFCSFEEALNDKGTLVVDGEVFRGQGDSAAQSLDGNLRKLHVLLINVQDGGVKDLPDLRVV